MIGELTAGLQILTCVLMVSATAIWFSVLFYCHKQMDKHDLDMIDLHKQLIDMRGNVNGICLSQRRQAELIDKLTTKVVTIMNREINS